jgi:hypothetical protein
MHSRRAARRSNDSTRPDVQSLATRRLLQSVTRRLGVIDPSATGVSMASAVELEACAGCDRLVSSRRRRRALNVPTGSGQARMRTRWSIFDFDTHERPNADAVPVSNRRDGMVMRKQTLKPPV